MTRLYTVTVEVRHRVAVEAADPESAIADAEKQLKAELRRMDCDVGEGSVDEVEAAGFEHDDCEVAHAD